MAPYFTRNSQSIAAVVPGVKLSRSDVGGSQMMEQVAQSTHGSLAKDISMQVDGMPVNSSMNDYGIQAYNDDALNQEVSVMTSSVPAEVGAGGVRINMIPKDGANKLFGALYAGGTPESWQSLNIDDNLRARGVRTARVGQRDTVVPKVWLRVANVDPTLERQLADIALQMEGSELRTCP